MQVETYECSETSAEPIEATEEAIGIIESLGLDGQKSMLSPTNDGAKTRCPYREMKRDERFVYGVLCPGKTLLKQYALGPIPLRVLQIAAHASSLEMFENLVVWHAEEASIPDPVLIGVAAGIQYSWDKRHFILARWGDELESWPTLLKRAVAAKREQIADVYRSIAAKIQSASLAEEITAAQLIEKGPDYAPELRI